jgi:hypothetical protein
MKTFKNFVIFFVVVIFSLTSCKTQKYGCYDFSERPCEREQCDSPC